MKKLSVPEAAQAARKATVAKPAKKKALKPYPWVVCRDCDRYEAWRKAAGK